MKKIIKLTEKDLTNIIKKILSEQTTNKTGGSNTNKPKKPKPTKTNPVKYEKLPKTIKIRAGGKFFVELNEVTKNNTYCVFRGQIRGRTSNSLKAGYDCNRQYQIALVENRQRVGDNITEKISPKANDLLKTACDCGGYVMNKSSEPSDMA